MFQYSYDTIIGKIFIAEKNGFIAQVSFKEISAEKKETALIKKTYLELAEYFNGKRQIFNVPLSPEGTPFQKKVWEELKKIPYGQTATYKEIAKGIDNAGYWGFEVASKVIPESLGPVGKLGSFGSRVIAGLIKSGADAIPAGATKYHCNKCGYTWYEYTKYE